MAKGNALDITRPGRPSTYCEDKALEICTRMALGETLAQICRDQDMPGRATVYRWQESQPGFRVMYQRAREALVEFWADELVDIADDTSLDTVTKVTPQGREYEATDHENIQRSKLRVDTRKWLMAKLRPGQYGDKVEHEHSGMVGHAHLHADLDDKETVRRLALFLMEDPQAPALEAEAEEPDGQ